MRLASRDTNISTKAINYMILKRLVDPHVCDKVKKEQLLTIVNFPAERQIIVEVCSTRWEIIFSEISCYKGGRYY